MPPGNRYCREIISEASYLSALKMIGDDRERKSRRETARGRERKRKRERETPLSSRRDTSSGLLPISSLEDTRATRTKKVILHAGEPGVRALCLWFHNFRAAERAPAPDESVVPDLMRGIRQGSPHPGHRDKLGWERRLSRLSLSLRATRWTKFARSLRDRRRKRSIVPLRDFASYVIPHSSQIKCKIGFPEGTGDHSLKVIPGLLGRLMN